MQTITQQLTKYKTPLLVLGTILVIGGIGWFVLWPQSQNFLADKDKIIDLNTKAGNLEQKASELQRVNKQDLDQDIQVVFTILPTDPNVPQAIITLQDLAQKADLTVTALKFGKSAAKSESEIFRINITSQGKADQIKTFLQSLNSSPRVYQIESITGRAIKLNDSTLETELPFLVYYKAAPNAVPEQDQIVTNLNDREKKLLADLKSAIAQAGYSPTNDLIAVPLGKDDPFQ